MAVRKSERFSKVETARRPFSPQLLSWIEARALWLAVALVVLGSIRIVLTYTVFNHTSDEPAHVACGMEWLDKGIYQWEPQHPPLARVAAALPLYLAGLRSQNTRRDLRFAMSLEGAAILYSNHQYERNLALARLGILPFFWLACAVVYAWGARYFRPAVALTAVFLFSMVPTVLAHAGLATTDMALTATLGAAFLAGLIWIESPTSRNAVWFGAATGLMTVSKFSALAFFPASAAVALGWCVYRERPGWQALARWTRDRVPSFAVAVAAGALLIWAVYRFSFGDAGFFHLRLPAPELYAGIRQVMDHNAGGQESYLLGERSQTGFWLFFPVALAVKSPLAFLVLAAVGAVLVFRKDGGNRNLRIVLAFCVSILAVGMSSRINIGLRHILPIYLGLSLLGAVAVVTLLEWSDPRPWLRGALALLILWLAGSSLRSHPDYLAYFNETAGSEPEKILVDSDLDWGQDLKRLASRLREVGATGVAFDRYILGNPEKELGFPPVYPLDPNAPRVGWNAIGVSVWKETGLRKWPDFIKPRERVGKSILLWYFPPAASNAGPAQR